MSTKLQVTYTHLSFRFFHYVFLKYNNVDKIITKIYRTPVKQK